MSEAKLDRLIVPTVYRKGYLLPLKAPSHNNDAQPLIHDMTRIQQWSSAFDYGMEHLGLRDALARCNALEENLHRHPLFFP